MTSTTSINLRPWTGHSPLPQRNLDELLATLQRRRAEEVLEAKKSGPSKKRSTTEGPKADVEPKAKRTRKQRVTAPSKEMIEKLMEYPPELRARIAELQGIKL